MRYVSWADLHRDVDAFARRYIGRVAGVVGVPRSGAMVAALLGLRLHVPVSDVDSFAADRWWSHGPRLAGNGGGDTVLLVDDSANSGGALTRAAGQLGGGLKPFRLGRHEVVPCALYAERGIARQVAHQRVVPGPRLFAWNWHAHGLSKYALWDCDGVVCEDPPVAEDDENGYVAAIVSARPLYLPAWPLRGIVTHRLEKRRQATVDWLRRHGVAPPGKLVMRPEATCHERRAKGDQNGTWKGEVYRADAGAHCFVESDPAQATRIYRVSGKPVLCPAVDKMWGAER